MRLRPHPRWWHEDHGASLIVVVLVLPVLILFASLAVDTAHWFVHKRHLQTQADAGVLAAARDFQFPCGSTATDPPNPGIIARAHQYDGYAAGAYNPQISNPASPAPTPATTYSPSLANHNLFSLVNAASYINQSVPNDTDVSGDPCADKAIDLKLTETNTPWFFKLLGVDYINAQARVSLQQLVSAGQQLPLAVPSPTPAKMQANFIDEGDGGTVLASVPLTSTNQTDWSSVPVTVPFPTTVKGPVGLVMALGGGSSTTCGVTGVTCFDTGAASQPLVPTRGIVMVRPWTTAGTPGKVVTGGVEGPRARSATLSSTCATAYFSAAAGTCAVQLTADLEFAPTGVTCADLTVTLKTPGAVPSTQPMTCPTSAGAPTGTWTSAPVTVPANSGPTSFTADWSQSTGTIPVGASGGEKNGPDKGNCTPANPCKDTFGVLHRTFRGASDLSNAGSSRSGPISSATVTDAATSAQVDSVQTCTGCSRSVVVNVSVYGLETTTSITAAPIRLHLDGSQGNQALTCSNNNSAGDFQTAIAKGCPVPYVAPPPQPYAINTDPAGACASTAPLTCVASNPGTGKQIEPGINARINCGGVISGCSPTACTNPNYWTAPRTVSEVLAYPDPRLVQVFITPSGAFQSSGTSTDYPIRRFASFYITGYEGSPCTTGGTTTPRGNYIPDDAAGTGEIVGHFVTYTRPGSAGTGSGQCKPSVLGDCIAILTK